MAAVRVCLAYIAACIVVGFAWMIVAMVSSTGSDVAEALTLWGFISLLVGGFGLLPFVILRSMMWLMQKETLFMTALFGVVMGALLFGLVFGPWMGLGNPADLLSVFASGAALGAVGGGVYWWIETWLWRVWPEKVEESA